LLEPAAELEKVSHDPKLYFDTPAIFDPKVLNVAFVMHGIRDDGYWTHRLAKAIKEHAAKQNLRFEAITAIYGYFAMLPFVLSWIRSQKVEWLMDLYVSAKARFPSATFHYVGHSNGTYLAAKALEQYPAARFGHIYFAGSVVRTDFDWPAYVNEKRVQKIHIARGATDWVVALLPKSLDYFTDLGGVGFEGTERGGGTGYSIGGYGYGGHGGAIREAHWSRIAGFVVNGVKPSETSWPVAVAGDVGANAEPPEELFARSPNLILDALSRLTFWRSRGRFGHTGLGSHYGVLAISVRRLGLEPATDSPRAAPD
jgi:hypothetical protein